jgi:hypothetical protein
VSEGPPAPAVPLLELPLGLLPPLAPPLLQVPLVLLRLEPEPPELLLPPQARLESHVPATAAEYCNPPPPDPCVVAQPSLPPAGKP